MPKWHRVLPHVATKQHWEFSIRIIQGSGRADLVQIPILVQPGDLPCGE